MSRHGGSRRRVWPAFCLPPPQGLLDLLLHHIVDQLGFYAVLGSEAHHRQAVCRPVLSTKRAHTLFFHDGHVFENTTTHRSARATYTLVKTVAYCSMACSSTACPSRLIHASSTTDGALSFSIDVARR